MERKTWTVLFLVAAAAISAVGFGYDKFEGSRIRREKSEEISAIGKMKAAQIELWRAERVMDAAVLAGSPFFVRAASALLAGTATREGAEEVAKRLRLELQGSCCQDAFLLGLDGTVLARAGQGGTPPLPIDLATVDESVRTGVPIIGDLSQGQDGRIHMDVVAPMLDRQSQPIAALVLRRAPGVDLFPLIETWPKRTETGEVTLVRRDSEDVLVLSGLRDDPDAAMRRQAPLAETDTVAVQAALGVRGPTSGKDLHGNEVLADIREVAGTDWVLVTKVSAEEVLAEARYRTMVAIGFVVLLVGLAGVTTIMLERGHRTRLAGALQTAEQARREAEIKLDAEAALRRSEQERTLIAARYRQAQKMEAVGRLAGGVAHDFNNMLNVISGYAELSQMWVSKEDPIHGYIGEIRKATARSAALTRQLLAFARTQPVSPRNIDVSDQIEKSRNMLARLIGEDIQLDLVHALDLWPVKIDPAQLDQVLANLVVNSRDAISGHGKIVIEASNVVLDQAFCDRHPGFRMGEHVLISFSDDGCGMDKATMDRLFEPFFTTKGEGKGTGLGLATVYGVVHQNKGFISVYSELGKGTTFGIYLPHAEGAVVHEPLPIETRSLRGTEKILVVEDEEQILELCREILEIHGYSVLSARTPGEALLLAEKNASDLSLLVTDVVMPIMNGKEIACRISGLKPGIPVFYMSGYPSNVIADRGVLEEGVEFIQKPFSPKEFTRRVREILDRPNPC